MNCVVIISMSVNPSDSDAQVECNTDTIVDGTMALHLKTRNKNDGEASRNEGFLEIYKNYEWKRVCVSEWNILLTQIACKQMGYSHGAYENDGVFKLWDASEKIFYNDFKYHGVLRSAVNCNDNDIAISSCLNDADKSCFFNHVYMKCYEAWDVTSQWDNITSVSLSPSAECESILNAGKTEMANDIPLSCQGRCAEVPSVRSTWCYCDSKCADNNDCCYDYTDACWHDTQDDGKNDGPKETRDRNTSESQDPKPAEENDLSQYKECVETYENYDQLRQYKMIARCPSYTQDQNLAMLCIDASFSFDLSGHKFSSIARLPVYINETGETFKNVYCAICHGFGLDDVLAWSLRYDCLNVDGVERALQNKHMQDLRSLIHLNGCTLRPEGGRPRPMPCKANCRFITIPPRGVNLRQCHHHVDECDVRYVPTAYRQQRDLYMLYESCLKYSAPVIFQKDQVDKSPIIYKNIHCAVCNGADPYRLGCKVSNITNEGFEVITVMGNFVQKLVNDNHFFVLEWYYTLGDLVFSSNVSDLKACDENDLPESGPAHNFIDSLTLVNAYRCTYIGCLNENSMINRTCKRESLKDESLVQEDSVISMSTTVDDLPRIVGSNSTSAEFPTSGVGASQSTMGMRANSQAHVYHTCTCIEHVLLLALLNPLLIFF
ncbi:unnamed protein product [Owenia fusiformis]|uniref:Uncharacterized protein n=1 Tax=Owenia fusiformis TaxID=6347 RepID=A0A8J1UN07_OWEFU|nr:unnamed protein product [Owenia fusiformis]